MSDQAANSIVEQWSNDEAMLLQFVRDHEVLCPVCKYNLHALTVPRCPECGRALKLTVGTVEPFLAAWVVVAIGTFASSGIGALLTCFAVFQRPHFHEFIQYVAWWSFTASFPFALCAVLLRRQFLRLSRTIQWLIAILALTISAIQIAGFVIFIK